jgi:hypothetical protein
MTEVVKIEEWTLVDYRTLVLGQDREVVIGKIHSLDESKEPSLHGKVWGHPRIDDGHRAVTSEIVSAPEVVQEGSLLVTKSGTIYELGKPR